MEMTCDGPSSKREESRGLLDDAQQAGSLRVERSHALVEFLLACTQSFYCRSALPVGDRCGRHILADGDDAGNPPVTAQRAGCNCS